MDTLSIHKIHAINKYRKQQFINNLVLYTLTTMSCSLLVFSPFWYPPLRAAVNVFLSVYLPKILSLFFSAKVVFIVGNLIIFFLVGEFKIFTVPHPSEAHGARSQILQSFNKWGKPKIISLEEKGENRKMNLNCHQFAKGTTRKQVNSCEPHNGEALHGAHNYQTVSVSLKPTGPNIITVRHEETSFFKEVSREEKEDWGRKSDGEELQSYAKDLNKMADDFIARVNKQRRLEAELYSIHE